jgi:hypothetical protein
MQNINASVFYTHLTSMISLALMVSLAQQP